MITVIDVFRELNIEPTPEVTWAVGAHVRDLWSSRNEGQLPPKDDMETREFPTAVIASLSTGVSLCAFSEIHEAASYMMGWPIFTHHLADKELWSDIQQTIAAQCPSMPTELPGTTAENYLDKLAEIEAEIGKTVTIRKGSGLTAMRPTDGIPDHLKDHIMIVEV